MAGENLSLALIYAEVNFHKKDDFEIDQFDLYDVPQLGSND